MGYDQVETDVVTERRGGSVSAERVLREMALNAKIHGAPTFAIVIEDALANANVNNSRGNEMRSALRALLFALHARPLFGGPHLSLEDAIAAANSTLDKWQPGA